MTKKLNVLSLFNGCGMLRPALDKVGIEVENYYSSEIDKYASEIANKNYPDTVQLGDVTKWSEWDLPPIDLLTAGFPCQDLSVAGKQLGLNGERSGLLYDVLKIRDALKPKYFLFENVASMSQRWRDEITRLVGVNPVELNSKYWGAQNRARLFWTNIPGAKNIEMMQVQNDRKIYLKDILLDGSSDNTDAVSVGEYADLFVNSNRKLHILKADKPSDNRNHIAQLGGKSQGYCIYGRQGKSHTLSALGGGYSRMGLVFAGIAPDEYDALFINTDKTLHKLKDDVPSDDMVRVAEFEGGSQGYRVYGKQGKSQTLVALGGGAGAKTGLVFGIAKNNQNIGIRKLHPIECERLMNLPDNYTKGVSNSQRYKMLGNGWDVLVVAELLRGLVEPVTDIQPDLFGVAV